MKKLNLLLVLAVFAASLFSADAQQQAPGKFSLTVMPYAYTALEPYIDAQTMEIHHSRHHAAYVNNFNAAIAGTEAENMSLEEIMANISRFDMKVRNNGGGHYNHDLFWKILSPQGGGQPQGELAKAIDAAFGSFENLKTQINTAASARFGSGWAWLYVEKNGKLAVGSTPNQDNPLMDVSDIKGTPILGIDVWEHAYYLKYQNKRGDYLGAIWNVINWPEVERRYAEAVR
jgi:Fe-Mn family superoxide dismutase